MSVNESNSVGCSKLIDVRGCKAPNTTKQGKQYSIDINDDPRVLFKDTIGNGREMKFKRNCTITISPEKIYYNRDDVEIKPASIT